MKLDEQQKLQQRRKWKWKIEIISTNKMIMNLHLHLHFLLGHKQILVYQMQLVFYKISEWYTAPYYICVLEEGRQLTYIEEDEYEEKTENERKKKRNKNATWSRQQSINAP